MLGRQRAAFASNGVEVDNGSALDIGADTAGANTLNELTIRDNAQKQALGFEAQGMNFSEQASLNTLAGQNAKDAGLTNSLESAFSGAGTVAAKWYQFNYASNPYGGYPIQ